MRGVVALVLLALIASPGPSAQNAPAAVAAPRLIVLLVVDQLRFDYLDRDRALWQHGLRRLMSEGAVFDRAFYPYLNTVTCAGHATIGTGTLPYAHGVIMNEWWQRAAGRRMPCTEDPSIASVPYGPGQPERIGHSAFRLRVPTLGDRLRERTPASRVVSLSLKPRSAVMMAGRGRHLVTWFSDANTWATSTAYAASPVAAVDAFVAANPVERDRDAVWDRALPAPAYRTIDEGVGETPKTGWSARFPHPLAGAPGTAPAQFYDLWERSPWSDAYLGRLAASLIQTQQLGQRDVVDLLAVSFSALDYIGHDFGPDSQEVQDALVRLDRTIGDLFAALDTHVGRDRYVVGVSADHGVGPIPEQRRAQGGDAGRVLNAQVRKAAEEAMVAAHGPGPHVAHVEYSNVYLSERTRQLVDANPAALQPLIDAVGRLPGIERVLPTKGLETHRTSSDPALRAAALSYHPEETGEIMLILKPYWVNTDTSAATHGTMHAYDQHVPVILLGRPFRPGRYDERASPADLAPTLAAVIQLPMPAVDGRVLREALLAAGTSP